MSEHEIVKMVGISDSELREMDRFGQGATKSAACSSGILVKPLGKSLLQSCHRFDKRGGFVVFKDLAAIANSRSGCEHRTLFWNRWQFLQQFLIVAKSLEATIEGTGCFGEHQRVRAFSLLQRVCDITLMLIDFHDDVPAMVFTGGDATGFVCGIGQKCIQLSAELALAIHFRWANPIGRGQRFLGR